MHPNTGRRVATNLAMATLASPPCVLNCTVLYTVMADRLLTLLVQWLKEVIPQHRHSTVKRLYAPNDCDLAKKRWFMKGGKVSYGCAYCGEDSHTLGTSLRYVCCGRFFPSPTGRKGCQTDC